MRGYLQLRQDLGDVGLTGQSDHDVQLLQLDVDRVVILHEENLHLVLEDVRPLLNDQIDVPQSHVLNLRLGGEKSDQGWGEFL